MPTNPQYLEKTRSENRDTRFDAWRAAGGESPDTLPALAKLAASSNPSVPKTAREAMTTMKPSVRKLDTDDTGKAGARELAGSGTAGNDALDVRAHALRLLSLV